MQEKTLTAVGVSKTYGNTEVLHPTHLEIEPGKIYGLIGRNGAGKTTLLSILTAQNPASSGEVCYGGERVWENEKALGEICFSREINTMLLWGQNTYKIKHYLEMARCYYPHWDDAYAKRLIAEFGLDVRKKICKLSKGMTSMLTITLALASRAPITMMDEPVAGLDVAMRDRFYHLLLDDYEKTRRTFIVSTHIIEEAAPIFEEVLLMDKGALIEKRNTEEFLAGFRYVSGRDELVDTAVAGLEVLHSEGIGRQKTVCVRTREPLQLAGSAGEVDVSAVPLQKAFIYLTGGEKGENIA